MLKAPSQISKAPTQAGNPRGGSYPAHDKRQCADRSRFHRFSLEGERKHDRYRAGRLTRAMPSAGSEFAGPRGHANTVHAEFLNQAALLLPIGTRPHVGHGSDDGPLMRTPCRTIALSHG